MIESAQHDFVPSEYCDEQCHPSGVNNGRHCADCGQTERQGNHTR